MVVMRTLTCVLENSFLLHKPRVIARTTSSWLGNSFVSIKDANSAPFPQKKNSVVNIVTRPFGLRPNYDDIDCKIDCFGFKDFPLTLMSIRDSATIAVDSEASIAADFAGMSETLNRFGLTSCAILNVRSIFFKPCHNETPLFPL